MWGPILVVVCGLVKANAVNHGYVSSHDWLPRVPGTGILADQLIPDISSLPQDFDWRDVNGLNLVTADWNQHIPQYCGACWIHGTTSALNDRIKVMRKGRFPDVMLARQVLINCVPANDPKDPPPGCLGGDSAMIHNYLTHSKVPDETCMPYQAANMGCAADTICRNCLPGDAGCWAVDSWTGYGVSLHGNVKGEEAMMKEIYARGPIACGFATDMAFMLNFSQTVLENEGVYQTSKNLTADNIDHNMEVAGWGVTDSGVKYWVVRNSWGTYWGDAGWFKLLRGENMIMVEHDCYWAVPTFDELDETLSGRVLGDYVRGISEIKPANKTLAAVLAGPPKPGTLLPLETSAAIACATFIAGAAVAYLAARRTGVKLNPLLG